MIGEKIGPYRVIERLGAGGMGVVYRARDTKLDRDVAIKMLPEGFAGDHDRFLRFQREAKVLASLNHPQIAQIHGFEDLDGLHGLVMELVEGPTLAERIAAGRLPPDEALAIAKQIAEALEAAHARGIVHRDLKPANVKVRDDGVVKVLDFGLAKAIDPPSTSGASMSPTLSLHATQAGLILGTAAYMAPEQARGKAADTRADIWAFGVVLFEILAGTRPFPGDEISDTLAGILKSEPPWDALPRDTPAAIRRLLRRCLQKDRQQRLQHIGDARLEIDEARGATAPEHAAVPVGTLRRPLLWIAATTAAALAIGVVAGRQFSIAPEAPELRLEISAPVGMLTHFAISPDGRSIVYARTGRRGLVVREFDDSSPRALTGTEGAEYPFWSPDGRSLGFFANNKLQRVESDGGTPQALATVITPAGGTWNRDGVILYVPNDNGGVFQVPAGSSESRMVTPQRTPPLATRLPQFLPDGRRFLFHVARGGEPAGVYVGELASDAIQRILSTNAPALYGSGHLWFMRDGALVAQAFDPASRALSGPIMPVADGVLAGLLGNSISTSAAGPIGFRASPDRATQRLNRQLVWFDRSGKQMGIAGEPGGLASNPSLSPDGRSLLLQRTVQDNIDLWLIDLQRNVSSRLTDNPGIDSMPVWSPDNNRLIFNSTSTGGGEMAIATLDKSRAQERVDLPFSDGAKVTSDWSTDGRFVLYTHFNQSPATTDVWALPMQDKGKPLPVATTTYNERDAQFAPDGKWVAIESDEAGSAEIYLQPFTGPGAKQRVSLAGGTQVRWRRDGRELYYVAADETLMAVAIDLTAAPPSVGSPAKLFKTNISPIRSISRQQYVVSRDGQRFLILTDEEGPVPPITLLFNWKPPAVPGR
jgi:eukaryotic-like serine/threonine-protein kinase